ncbi:hypothetical protein PAMP_015272 [Pampus punctatissimus]
MGKINGCLRCLFIFFNVLFAVIGCLLILGVVKATVYSAQISAAGVPGIGWGWVFAIGMLAISCLGIFAGCSEKALVLKIFAGFMGAGILIMLIFGIVVVVVRNKFKNNLEATSSELSKSYIADENLKSLLEDIQLQSHCCGMGSVNDWGDEIPSSCECKSVYGCQALPQGKKGPSKIYSQSCSSYTFIFFDFFFKIIMIFCFSFAGIALLGLLISLLMIHQVKRHDSPGGASIAMKGY